MSPMVGGSMRMSLAASQGGEEPRTACAGFDELFALLAQGRFDLTHETATQAGIEQLLLATYARSQVSREHRLSPGDRPDFLIDGRLVVEVKGPRHRAPAVLRQLRRYAEHGCVQGIVLATSRAMTMPPVIPHPGRLVRVKVLNLGRAWL